MTDETDVRSQQIAALEAARAAVDHALALLHELDADAPVASAAMPDWTTAKIAAGELGVHVETLKRLATANGFGVRAEGSRWAIDRTRMRAWRERRPFVRLAGADMEKC